MARSIYILLWVVIEMGVPFMIGMALLQAGGQYAQGRQQAAAYEAQARTDEANAAMVQRQREQENYKNLDERRRLVARAADITGQNTAAFGAGGIDSASGTAASLKAANQDMLNQDLWTSNYNLQLADVGLRQNISNLEQSAASNRAAASATKRSATIGSILSLATSMAGIAGSKATSGATGAATRVNAPMVNYGLNGTTVSAPLFPTARTVGLANLLSGGRRLIPPG